MLMGEMYWNEENIQMKTEGKLLFNFLQITATNLTNKLINY